MPRILTAMDYGSRMVIVVCMNPTQPEWVHTVGERQKDTNAQPMVDALGQPMFITSSTVPAGETGESCHNCRYNWQLREFIWDSQDMKKTVLVDGKDTLIAKTSDDYLAEIQTALAPAVNARPMVMLQGVVL